MGFAYGARLPLRPAVPGRSAFPSRPFRLDDKTSVCPTTPGWQRIAAYTHPGLGIMRVRSPLLAQSRLIFFPPVTEMFQLAGLYSFAYGFSKR